MPCLGKEIDINKKDGRTSENESFPIRNTETKF